MQFRNSLYLAPMNKETDRNTYRQTDRYIDSSSTSLFLLLLMSFFMHFLSQVDVCWQIFTMESVSCLLPAVDLAICCSWMSTCYQFTDKRSWNQWSFWHSATPRCSMVKKGLCTISPSGAASLYPLLLPHIKLKVLNLVNNYWTCKL